MASKLNGAGKEREFWAVAPVVPLEQSMAMGKTMEEIGFTGAFVLQIYGPPFAPLVPLACASSKLKVATGVAVAASRSPFETAYAAMDMDRITNGRFVLGLGSALKSATVGMYGVPDYKLLTHLRDTVKAVRHIVAGAHKGLEPYDGVYYKADYQEMIPTAPPVRERIPIWVAALREKMTEFALEEADGLIAHALWTTSWTNNQIAPLIDKTLAAKGRARDDIEINCWPWVAVNNDKQQAINDSRPTVAAYAGIKSYEHIFEAHGYLKEARICQEASLRQSDVLSVVDKVPDEMVLDFVSCGPVEDVLEQIEPFWNVANSLCPMTPYRHLTPEQLQFYGEGVYQLVAAAKS
jgi:alkanesulfonate monooxygenase SsuD/methylene tetrahydromethanopterin reductase-like flavin-dependent oxidoreductase (luciferase family)